MESYFVETAGDGYYRVRTDGLCEGDEQPTEIFGTFREAKDWISAKIQIAMKTATGSDVT